MKYINQELFKMKQYISWNDFKELWYNELITLEKEKTKNNTITLKTKNKEAENGVSHLVRKSDNKCRAGSRKLGV